MTEQIGGLSVILTADASRMMKDIAAARAQLQTQTKAMTSSLDNFQAGVERQFAPLLAWKNLTIAAAAVGAVALIKGALDSASALQDAADRTGVGVEALQAWRFAAIQAGTSTDQFDKSLLVFARNVGDARNGTGALVDALRLSDRAFLDLLRTAPTMEAALQGAFDKLASIEDPARRAALASDLFGKEGAKLNNMLKDGAISAAALTVELKKTGQILSKETIEAAEKAGDALQALALQIDVAKNRLLLGMVPALTAAAKGWNAYTAAVSSERFQLMEKYLAKLNDELDALDEKRRRIAKTPQDKSLLSSLGWADSPRDRLLAKLDEEMAERRKIVAYIEKELGIGKELTEEKKKETDVRGANLPLLKAEIEERNRIAVALGNEMEKTELLIGKMDDLKDKRTAAANKDAFDASEEKRLMDLDALADAYNSGGLSIEAYIVQSRKLTEANRETTRGLSDLQEVTRDLGNVGASAFEGIVHEVMLGKAAMLDYQSIVRSLIADIAVLLARRYITQPFVNSIVAGAGGGGSIGGESAVSMNLRPPAVTVGDTVGQAGGVTNYRAGDNYYYNVTAADVAVLEARGQRISQQTVRSLLNARARGGRV